MNDDVEAAVSEHFYSETPEDAASMHEGERPEAAARAGERRHTAKARHQVDAMDRMMAAQGKRISANEAALAAGTVVDEFQTQFPDLTENRIIRAAIPIAPLLLLRPSQRGIRDPRLLAGAAAVALAIGAELTNKERRVEGVEITRSTTAPLKTGDEFKLSAEARDGSGRPIPGMSPKWEVSDPKLVEVDQSGVVTAKKSGTARITATVTADGGPPVSDFALVTVE
jgi:hypothetical protein